jgi:hypothetical protein
MLSHKQRFGSGRCNGAHPVNRAQNLELFPQLFSFIVLLLQEALLVR